jgi:histidinol phosphatase-like PHP family hydrolase
MQAEGREWVRLFSPQAVARFDYVFTDAMTFTNEKGRRMRLWIPDEVEVGDKQEFMNTLVERIVGIMDNEPIDIYVNPTVLPESIAAEYEALWTAERVEKVIDAALRNGIALEINNRYRLPRAAFIRKAKKAGVKFTIGTNNAGSDLGRIEYALQMVRECGLTWQNMWMPKPDGQKPIQTRGFK